MLKNDKKQVELEALIASANRETPTAGRHGTHGRVIGSAVSGKACASDGQTASQYVRVTPALAQQWVNNNACNRPLNRARVRYYARQMKKGIWHHNGQGAGFDAEGRLICGQHRLYAIIESGVTVEMLVSTGLQPEAAGSSNDGLRGAGMIGVKYANNVASMLRMLYWLKTGDNDMLSGGELAFMMEEHSEALALVMPFFSKARCGQRRSQYWGAFLATAETHPRATQELMNDFVTGLNLGPKSPALQLRRAPAGKGEREKRLVAVKSLTCVMRHARGTSSSTLQIAPAALASFFPELHGLRSVL